jgi:hypothetical protein
VYDSMHAYSANALDLFVMFKSRSEIPPEQWKHIKRSKVFKENSKKDIFPMFTRLSSSITEEDMIWFETALPAIGKFVRYCAVLGGGSRDGLSAELLSTVTLTPEEVLYSVIDRRMNNLSLLQCNDVKSLISEYPCVQDVPSAGGMMSRVTMHVLLSQAVLAHAQRQQSNVTTGDDVLRSPFSTVNASMPQATNKACMVCRTTESDLRSRGGKLLGCPCKEDGIKYW